MNGVYWHSDKFKDKDYHLSKTLECEKRGIVLVNIWEDEWTKDKQKMKNFIDLVLNGKRAGKKDKKQIILQDFICEDISTHIKLPRDKFNRCLKISGAECIGETDPD